MQRIDVEIGLSIDEKSRDTIVKSLTGMEKARFVYLDLKIKKECAVGEMKMEPGVTYPLGPLAGYNHLLITVYTGNRTTFPYNDVACEYSGQPGENVFHVRGFFNVIANSIPTAQALQLRPFNPPFKVAKKVLKPEDDD